MAKRETAETSRRRILAAAARRFGELGFERTRVEDVAREVGLGRSAVLYHFESKRLLYEAVLADLYGDLFERQREILQAPGTLGERIERSVAALVDAVAQQPALAQIALRTAATTDAGEEKDARQHAEPFARLIQDIVVSSSIEAAGLDYRLLVSLIVGPVLYYVAGLPTFLGPQSEDPMAPGPIEALKHSVVSNALRLLDEAAPPDAPGSRPPA